MVLIVNFELDLLNELIVLQLLLSSRHDCFKVHVWVGIYTHTHTPVKN